MSPLAILDFEVQDTGTNCAGETFGDATASPDSPADCDNVTHKSEGTQGWYADNTAGVFVEWENVVSDAQGALRNTISFDFKPIALPAASATYNMRAYSDSGAVRPDIGNKAEGGNYALRARCDSLMGSWLELTLDEWYRVHMTVDVTNDYCRVEIYDDTTLLYSEEDTSFTNHNNPVDGFGLYKSATGEWAVDNVKWWNGDPPESDLYGPPPPPPAPPSTETACSDGTDNDGDGLIDCLDPDCDGLSGGAGICEYGSETLCSDSFDNDADGDVDGADSDCGVAQTDCTDGTDCLCDTVSAPGAGSIGLCYDFEEDVLYAADDTVVGNWTYFTDPYFSRGSANHWRTYYGSYGPPSGPHAYPGYWQDGEPGLTPRQGGQCDRTSGGDCVGLKEWCSEQQGNLVDGLGADCWEANDKQPMVDIMRDGDHNAEVTDLSAPTHPGGTGAPGTGKTWMAHRIEPDSQGGFVGFEDLGSGNFDVGVTMLMAFPDNLIDSNTLQGAWKFDQINAASDAIAGFSSSPIGMKDHFPYQGFLSNCSGGPTAPLITNLTAGTETGEVRGVFDCNGKFRFRGEDASPHYDFATDWGYSKWGCMRVRMTDFDTTNACMTMWYGDGTSETPVVDFCGLDATTLQIGTEGISSWKMNSFPNYHANSTGSTGEVTYRWQDNMVIVLGDEPVSCSAVFESP